MKKIARLAGITALVASAGLFNLTSAEAANGNVANSFARDCSRITRHCTGYTQRNGTYDPTVRSTYADIWVWRWI